MFLSSMPQLVLEPFIRARSRSVSARSDERNGVDLQCRKPDFEGLKDSEYFNRVWKSHGAISMSVEKHRDKTVHGAISMSVEKHSDKTVPIVRYLPVCQNTVSGKKAQMQFMSECWL